MTKDEIKRLKLIEEELAYLRKEILELNSKLRPEIHYHYYYDYESILGIINQSYNQEDDII